VPRPVPRPVLRLVHDFAVEGSRHAKDEEQIQQRVDSNALNVGRFKNACFILKPFSQKGMVAHFPIEEQFDLS
jgi:hypothetical protein